MFSASVRCRKCATCRAWNQNQWIRRIQAEVAVAPRTWFITPTSAFGGIDPANADKWFGKQLQLALKRLRKSGAKFRFVATKEIHEGGGKNHGLPHWHALLSEVVPRSVTAVRIRAAFDRIGFTNPKLVRAMDDAERDRIIRYVAKYVTKEGGAVRASKWYGDADAIARIYLPAKTVIRQQPVEAPQAENSQPEATGAAVENVAAGVP